jgi:mandelate racemase
MHSEHKLTLERIDVRAVSIPMRRPIVSKVGVYPEWPFILIDVKTKEGVVGRSYLEPYLKEAVRYIGPAILDLAEMLKGRRLAPLDFYRDAMNRLHLIGRQGVSLIVAAGVDMAVWDALAKAAGLPLAELLGGSVGQLRTYNTNGLWLIPLDRLAKEAEELVAEGNFNAIKIRLGHLPCGRTWRHSRQYARRSDLTSSLCAILIRVLHCTKQSLDVIVWTTKGSIGLKSQLYLTTTRIAPN